MIPVCRDSAPSGEGRPTRKERKMNEKEALEILETRTGFNRELLPFFMELSMDLTTLNPLRPETVRRLGRVLDLRPGMKVLDLACGKGGISLPLVNTYKVSLVGVDLMPDFIRDAWSRAEFTGLYDLCDFRLDDAARFAEQTSNQWDAVLIVGALPYIWEGVENGLKKAGGLAVSGGKLVIGLPYGLPGAEADPEGPWPSLEESTAQMAAGGRVVEVLDDGTGGWEHYVDPQLEVVSSLRAKNPDNETLTAFLDEWVKRMEWERNNLGFALWVIQVD